MHLSSTDPEASQPDVNSTPNTSPSKARHDQRHVRRDNLVLSIHITNTTPPSKIPATRETSAASLPAPLPLEALEVAAALAELLALPEALLWALETTPNTPPCMLDGVPLLLTPEAADLYAFKVLLPDLSRDMSKGITQ
jgi:hypothetical protein